MSFRIAIVCVLACLTTQLHSQDVVPTAITPRNNAGPLPYSTQLGSSVEIIDLASGNLTVNLPVIDIPGIHGMRFRYGLRYSSLFWDFFPGSQYSEFRPEMKNWLTPDTLGWTSTQPYVTYVTQKVLCDSPEAPKQPEPGPDEGPTPLFFDFGATTTGNFIFTDGDGVKHSTIIKQQNSGGRPEGSWNLNNGTGPSLGGDGWWAAGGEGWVDKNGSVFNPGLGPGTYDRQTGMALADMAQETNALGDQQLLAPGQKDSTGRVPLTSNISSDNTALIYTLQDSDGVSRSLVGHLAVQNIATTFGYSAVKEFPYSPASKTPRRMLTDFVQQNGQSYTFQYDNFGEITQLTTPTHLTVSYIWSDGFSGTYCPPTSCAASRSAKFRMVGTRVCGTSSTLSLSTIQGQGIRLRSLQ